MTDKDLGLKVVRYFWTWNRSFYGQTFQLSFDEFLKRIAPTQTKLDIYLDGIGGGVREAGMSDSRISSGMRALALASKGKVPSNYQIYFKFLINEAVKVDWVDAVVFTVVESAKDTIKGAQAVGDSILLTGKILNFLLPAIALFFFFFWMNKKTEGSLVAVAKSFKK